MKNNIKIRLLVVGTFWLLSANFKGFAQTYYSKPAGNLHETSTWGSQTDGNGSSPTDFITKGQQFIISNRSGSIDLSASWEMGGKLIVEDGITLNSNGYLTIKSFASHTGIVGELTGSANIIGDVTVERFIPAFGYRAYRLLAPSVNTTTSINSNWQEGVNKTNPWDPAGVNPNAGYGTHITGSNSGSNGFDATPTGAPSLYLFDQVPSTQSWQAMQNTNATNLDANKGYLLFLRGCRDVNLTSASNPSSNTTLRAKGTLQTGTINFNNQEGDGRFSLVSNPYASPISWAAIYTEASNMNNFESAYYLWDPTIGSRGGYVTVNNAGTKSNMASNATVEIQSGQAFFIKAKTGVNNPTFTILESHKSDNNDRNVFRTGNPERLSIGLFYNMANGSRRSADGVIIDFNNNFSSNIEAYDIEDMPNWDENLAINRHGKLLSIEGRPLIDQADTIALSITRLKVQAYELQLDGSQFSHPTLQAFVYDKFLGSQTPLNLNGTNVIPFTVIADPGSNAADRFSVIFGASAPLSVNLTSVKAFSKNNGIQVEWNVQNEINMDKYVVEHSTDATTFKTVETVKATGVSNYSILDANNNNGVNYYRIKAIGKTGETQYSSLVKVNGIKVSNMVSIFPNPVKGNTINIQLNGDKGDYSVIITNKTGQQLYNKAISHTGGQANHAINMDKNFVTGIYQMQVTNNGSTQTQQLIKQ